VKKKNRERALSTRAAWTARRGEKVGEVRQTTVGTAFVGEGGFLAQCQGSSSKEERERSPNMVRKKKTKNSISGEHKVEGKKGKVNLDFSKKWGHLPSQCLRGR